MKFTFLHSIALVGLLGCCSGSHADISTEPSRAVHPALLPVRSAVLVKEVKGKVEYAYDSTGWRTLEEGKLLRAGATVRAASGGLAILRIPESVSFFKISPQTTLHITSEAPADELSEMAIAQKRTSAKTLSAITAE